MKFARSGSHGHPQTSLNRASSSIAHMQYFRITHYGCVSVRSLDWGGNRHALSAQERHVRNSLTVSADGVSHCALDTVPVNLDDVYKLQSKHCG